MREAPVSVRLGPELKGRLAGAARRNGRSLHAEIVGRLERSLGGEERAAGIVARAVRTAPVADFEPRAKTQRTETCEHRIPVGAYCYQGCDG